MADLRALVRSVHATAGVRAALAAGPDGLLIDAAGLAGAAAEHVAALAPGLTRAAAQVSDAAGHGTVHALAVEGADGVLVVLPLTADVTLLALLEAGEGAAVGDAAAALRRSRAEYARLA